jgi:hypothetical protein
MGRHAEGDEALRAISCIAKAVAMAKTDDKKSNQPDILDGLIDTEMPPLGDEELAEPSLEEMVGYLETDFDTESSATDPDTIDPLEDFGIHDLIDPIESSWTEETESSFHVEIHVPADEEDSVWVDGEQEEFDPLEEEWFAEEPFDYGQPDDGGIEGPIETNDIQIDEDRFATLEAEDDTSVEGETTVEAMERLGIEIPESRNQFASRVLPAGPELLLDKFFLGLKDNLVVAAAFRAGSVLAVGEGLYVLGADSLLHPAATASGMAGIIATSVCVNSTTTVIGTKRSGAMITTDFGKTVTPINSWLTHGLETNKHLLKGRISTSFSVVGQHTEQGYRLFGRTGEGHVFSSNDMGNIWIGPIIRGRCLALAAVRGTDEMVAVVDASSNIVLFCGYKIDNWQERRLPEEIVGLAKSQKICLAASGKTILIAVNDPLIPLYASFDGGLGWTPLDGVTRVTAMVVDAEDPGWMAVAVAATGNKPAIVKISEDSGVSWRIVLSLPLEDNTDGNQVEISDLVLEVGRTRELVAVSSIGVFEMVLLRRGMAH